MKDALMNGFRPDEESTSRYRPSNNSESKSLMSNSDKSSKQQSNLKSAQPDMLSDLAAIVKSTSIDGQVMPGHRPRQKASSKLTIDLIISFLLISIFLGNTVNKPSLSSSSTSNTKQESEAFDASDELLDNLVKNVSLTTKDVTRQRKLARYAQRQSCTFFTIYFFEDIYILLF
jgi:preprotein translocase subunit SecG